MKKTLVKLLKEYPAEVIESALVDIFISENNLSVKKNKLLLDVLASAEGDNDTVRKEILDKADWSDVTSLVNVFELLIPQEDKKINGAFFTPRNITDFMSSEVVRKPGQKICDPSCGCGAFLVASAKLLKENFGTSIVESLEQYLYGVDISDYSIKRAKILLSLLALQYGEDVEDIKFNLSVADSLKVEWPELFDDKTFLFDVVIGNPPYVKFQDLPDRLRVDLFNDWKTLKKGSYNLYFAFFELGVEILKDDGVLAFITPNNYFTSISGENLRQYLNSNGLIERIIDFNHLLLFDVQTYTCITFIGRKHKKSFSYERIDAYDDLKSIKDLNYSIVENKSLDDKKWRLLREKDFYNIRKIENDFTPLGDIVDIRVGVATCKDSVYFIDGSTFEGGKYYKLYNGKKFPIEKEITRDVSKISDFKSQKDLDGNARKIIFPYEVVNGTVQLISERDLRDKYPNTYNYLCEARSELDGRDKGKVKYPAWYAYARTQGLSYYGEKLLTPTFSSQPRFLLDTNEKSLFLNGYALFKKKRDGLGLLFQGENLDLTVLQKILNSAVMHYYITLTSVSISGGYPCYQKNFIERFGIPGLSKSDIDFLLGEKDKRKIDTFLIKKYDLSLEQ